MPGLGLGRHQQGPREFTITVDHDISYGLGYIPTADDARHMARLRRERESESSHVWHSIRLSPSPVHFSVG